MIDDRIKSSSIRGHASYPHLNFEAVQDFRREYGVAPGKMKEEDAQDFFYLVANDFIEHDGVEWRIETEQVEDLDELMAMLQLCRNSGGRKIETDHSMLPDTDPDGTVLHPETFDRLVAAYEKAGEEATYMAVAPYERIVHDDHGISAVEEIWGLEVDEDLLESIEARDPIHEIAD